MGVERCIFCGSIIPEGNMACPGGCNSIRGGNKMNNESKRAKVGDKIKVTTSKNHKYYNGYEGKVINSIKDSELVSIRVNNKMECILCLRSEEYTIIPEERSSNINEEDQLKHIADTYGYEAQSRQMIEEMAELTVAINKVWRNRNGIVEEKYKAHNDMISELADVSIMLEQMIYLLDCEDKVISVREMKIKRQLDRIESKKKN